MELSNFILDVINKVLDDKNEVHNSAHVGAQRLERQSVHRNMHKIPASYYALTIFYAVNYDFHANHGTDAIILSGSQAGLPRPRNPVPLDLRRGEFFVKYSDLIHAGAAVPMLLPFNSWRKVGFLGLAIFPVTYQFTQGIHVLFWFFKEATTSVRKAALLNGEVP